MGTTAAQFAMDSASRACWRTDMPQGTILVHTDGSFDHDVATPPTGSRAGVDFKRTRDPLHGIPRRHENAPAGPIFISVGREHLHLAAGRRLALPGGDVNGPAGARGRFPGEDVDVSARPGPAEHEPRRREPTPNSYFLRARVTIS